VSGRLATEGIGRIQLAPVQGMHVYKPKTVGDGREEERVSAIPCSERSSCTEFSRPVSSNPQFTNVCLSNVK